MSYCVLFGLELHFYMFMDNLSCSGTILSQYPRAEKENLDFLFIFHESLQGFLHTREGSIITRWHYINNHTLLCKFDFFFCNITPTRKETKGSNFRFQASFNIFHFIITTCLFNKYLLFTNAGHCVRVMNS